MNIGGRKNSTCIQIRISNESFLAPSSRHQENFDEGQFCRKKPSGLESDSLCYSRASVHTAVCLLYVRGLEPVCVRRYACRTYVD